MNCGSTSATVSFGFGQIEFSSVITSALIRSKKSSIFILLAASKATEVGEAVVVLSAVNSAS
jgi:hypothetical protein